MSVHKNIAGCHFIMDFTTFVSYYIESTSTAQRFTCSAVKSEATVLCLLVQFLVSGMVSRTD